MTWDIIVPYPLFMDEAKEPSLLTPLVPSKIYLEAARSLAEGEEGYSCVAVERACGWMSAWPPHKLTLRYMKLMFDWNEWPTVARVDFNQDDRVIALCFMAAMSEVYDERPATEAKAK